MKRFRDMNNHILQTTVIIIFSIIFSASSQEISLTQVAKPPKKDLQKNNLLPGGIAIGIGRIEPGGDPEPTLSYWFCADIMRIAQKNIYIGIALSYYNADTHSDITEGTFRNFSFGPYIKIIFTNRFKIKPYSGFSLDIGLLQRKSKLIKDIPNAIVAKSRSDKEFGTNIFLGMNYPVNSKLGVSLDIRQHLDGFDFYLGPVSSTGVFIGAIIFIK